MQQQNQRSSPLTLVGMEPLPQVAIALAKARFQDPPTLLVTANQAKKATPSCLPLVPALWLKKTFAFNNGEATILSYETVSNDLDSKKIII